jgi:hypothetical protein
VSTDNQRSGCPFCHYDQGHDPTMFCGRTLDALPHFDGKTYEPELDHARLGNQLAAVRDLMADGKHRTLADISKATGFPEASVSARLRDLRKLKFGGLNVQRDRIGEGLFVYWVSP